MSLVDLAQAMARFIENVEALAEAIPAPLREAVARVRAPERLEDVTGELATWLERLHHLDPEVAAEWMQVIEDVLRWAMHAETSEDPVRSDRAARLIEAAESALRMLGEMIQSGQLLEIASVAVEGWFHQLSSFLTDSAMEGFRDARERRRTGTTVEGRADQAAPHQRHEHVPNAPPAT